MTRVRRTEPSPVEERRPLYARMLCLRHLTPSGFLCFVFLEGAIALGLLLALAELVSWWGVLVLPALVALMVKLNDVIAGSLARAAQPAHPATTRPTRMRSSGVDPVGMRSSEVGPVGMRSSEVGPVETHPTETRPTEMLPTETRQVTTPGAAFHSAATAGPPAGMPMTEGASNRLPGMADRGRGGPIKRPWTERVETQEQWLRQSATRRYE